MKVRSEQLDSHLQSDLAPVYIVSGDEPLLVQEAADAIRSAARRQDYATRDLLHVERSFDWHSLLNSADTLSLYEIAEQSRRLGGQQPNASPPHSRPPTNPGRDSQ